MAVSYDIEVRQNRDFYLPVSVVTADTFFPANLSNYLPVMTVKAHVTDSDAAALYKGPPWGSNLPFGQFTFRIARSVNNLWWAGSGPVSTSIVYDVSVQDTAMTPDWVTLVEGNVTVVPAVTKSIP
jgi:hypothetical protein